MTMTARNAKSCVWLLTRDRQRRLERVDERAQDEPAERGPDHAPEPADHAADERDQQRPLAHVGSDRAGAEDVEERDDAREEAGDREGRRDHPVRAHAHELRHLEVLGRGAQLDAERGPLQEQRHPDQEATVTTIVMISSREMQNAADVELIREPRVRGDALLRPSSHGHPAEGLEAVADRERADEQHDRRRRFARGERRRAPSTRPHDDDEHRGHDHREPAPTCACRTSRTRRS